MKRIFLDTNFIIDYFIREEFQVPADYLLTYGKSQGVIFYISYLTLANFAYILRKQPKEQLFQILGKCIKLFQVIDNNVYQVTQAIKLTPKDFEDALQYQAALEGGCNCIITRNSKDFSFAKIPVYSPDEFISLYL
ncbi:MAG: PIN domain-containing protein [Muribaculaceae bacterium]|nr:PIN domain-containing protein [Muribaculaceae bacterium]